jgi:Uma2 family endonuclease
MSAHAQPRITPEQYLETERTADFRSEYYAGRVYAMAGGSFVHVHIIGNLTVALFQALKGRPCIVTPVDLRLRISPAGLYTYPDVMVVCGEPKFADDRRDTLLNPAFIVEVLSPSTEGYDRGFKAAQYRTIESLQEHALVSQTEPRVEVFRRQPGGRWLLSEFVGLDSVCNLEGLGCRIALSEIYDKVTFNAEEAGPAGRPA